MLPLPSSKILCFSLLKRLTIDAAAGSSLPVNDVERKTFVGLHSSGAIHGRDSRGRTENVSAMSS